MQSVCLLCTVNMSPVEFGILLVLLFSSRGVRGDDVTEPECKNATGCKTTTVKPPADSMSRLLPSSDVAQSNETKDVSASSIDIITTPETDGSLGLSAFSKFAQTSDTQAFNPSPFLGVIPEKGYQRGVAIGEVFPDTVGHRDYYNKYHLYHKGYHQGYDGLKNRPDLKPTPETIQNITPYQHEFRPTVESYKTTRTPEYPFVLPDKHSKYNTISEYKAPFEGYPSEKPIKEHIQDDRPFGHDDRPQFVGHIHGMLPPIGDHKKHVEPFGNKWKGIAKILATIIPFGLLVAALSPSILVVNATDTPVPTKTSFRSLDGIRLPVPPPGVNISECQMKEICYGIYSAEKTYQPYLESLIKRSGGVLKEIAEISAAGKCSNIPCKR